MTMPVRRRSHLSRHLARLRQQQGLRPSELAARIGASNVSKVGSLIGAFERGEPLSDHWFQKLVAVLQPEQAALQRWVELDLAEAQEQKRLARQACANQSIEPHLSIRCMPGFGLTIAVPAAHRGSREQFEAWAAAELQRFRGLHGTLIWSRGEQTFYAPNGARPRRQDLAPA